MYSNLILLTFNKTKQGRRIENQNIQLSRNPSQSIYKESILTLLLI